MRTVRRRVGDGAGTTSVEQVRSVTPRSDDEDDRRGPGPDPYRMPESEQLLRRVVEIVESAPGLPMSASVRINKDELLELLDDAVASLPEEIRNARWLLRGVAPPRAARTAAGTDVGRRTLRLSGRGAPPHPLQRRVVAWSGRPCAILCTGTDWR